MNRKWLRAAGPLILFSVLFLPGYIYQNAESAALVFSNASMMVQNLAIGVPQIALIVFFIISFNATAAAGLRFRPSDPVKALAVSAGIILVAAPAALLSRFLGDSGFIQTIPFSADPFRFALLLAVCLATGYREELFFRVYLLSELSHYGAVPASIASVALFSIGHLYQGVASFAATALIGAFLCVVYLKYRNAHIIAIGHGLYNFTVIVLGMAL